MTDTVEVPDEEIDWTTREMRDWFAFDSTDSVMGPARFDAWLAAVEARAAARERQRIADEIEARRAPMPEHASQAGLIGWVVDDEALKDAARIARGDAS